MDVIIESTDGGEFEVPNVTHVTITKDGVRVERDGDAYAEESHYDGDLVEVTE